MTGESELFPALVSIHFPSRGRALAIERPSGRVVELDALAAAVLSGLHGSRPVGDHVRHACQRLPQANPDAIVSSVQRLRASGLLRRSSLGVATASGLRVEPDVGSVDAVAIVTADRPSSLQKCLASLLEQCVEWGRHPEVIVIDGSRKEENRRQVAAVVSASAARAGHGCRYVGPVEAKEFVDAAFDSEDRALLRFGCTPGEVGANRNLLLLLTAGSRVLMLDDDAVCRPWRPADTEDNAYRLGGHHDSRTWRFCRSRREALESVRGGAEADLLAMHGRLLSRDLADIHGDYGTCLGGQACGHMLSALIDAPNSAKVRLTYAGLAGDAGRYSPTSFLFASGELRKLLSTDAGTFKRALTSREVTVCASILTMSHHASGMGFCLGADNTRMLPPFMPFARGEDGVFGALVVSTDSTALSASLPVGIVHDSDRGALYEDATMAAAARTRVSELLMAVIASMTTLGRGDTDIQRLDHFGRGLITLSELTPRSFGEWLRDTLIGSRSRMVMQALSEASSSVVAPHWTEALEEYADTFIRAAQGEDYCVPYEFGQALPHESRRELQKWLGEFGALVLAWPRLWSQARLVRQHGGLS